MINFSRSFRLIIAMPFLLALAVAVPVQAQTAEYKLVASDGEYLDLFGQSVSLSDDRALIGAPVLYPLAVGNGSAYIFEQQEDGSWVEIAKLTASDGAPNDFFGRSVSLVEDRALVGASGAEIPVNGGAAYVFERQSDGSWLEVAKLTASDGEFGDSFGVSVSLVEDRAIVGAPYDDDMGGSSGSAYVFEQQGDGSWVEATKLNASDGAPDDRFGNSVSLFGNRSLVGSPGRFVQGNGAAYLFERQGDGSWLEVDKLSASDGAPDDLFGLSVSLSSDGAIVGAPYDDDMGGSSGSAYVFEQQGDGSWIEATKLDASGAHVQRYFGWSVSLLGDRALVGALTDQHLGYRAGAAYQFQREEGGTWIEVGRILASDGSAHDEFGASVSLLGNHALVGAQVGGAANQGVAYVFENIFPVAIETPADIPDSYHLSEPYPNPFNPQAQFSLEVAHAQQVRIEVFNTLGQLVAVLHDGLLPGHGTHRFTFEAGLLPSGVYLLRVAGESFTATRTMTLVK